MTKNRQSESLENITCFLSGTLWLPLFLEVNMKKIKLTQGQYALIDDEDHDIVNLFKWCAFKTQYGFYSVTYVKPLDKWISICMHRLIINATRKEYVDHINHDGLDNRKENLRICTASQNGANRVPDKVGSSKYKGVSWNKATKQWRAFITVNNRCIYLGNFDHEKDAANAYNKKALEMFKNFAYINKFKEDIDND